MSNKESTGKTIIVALALCIVCSLVVSSAAVLLKGEQQRNKNLDRQSNILAAAGLLNPDQSVEEQFKQITTKVVDLETGKFLEVDPASIQPHKLAGMPDKSVNLSAAEDIAKISRRENTTLVYIVENNGNIEKVILPIRGYGLWSTLKGFMALESDLNTVAGLGFYEHAETPGLGGEVDNPKWKSQWPGKKVYRNGDVDIQLIKGTVDPSAADASWKVDGLAGATLTSRGVTNLVQFWLGELGFKKFLTNLKNGEAS